jgi:hypothetical protein
VVFRCQKGAEVMIEPPGNRGRGRVFEVDNRVFVAGKFLLVEKRAGAVHQAAEFIFRAGGDAFAMEPRKQRGRAGAVKTFIVVKNAYLHLRTITPLQLFFFGLKQLALLAADVVSSRIALPG